MGEKTDIDHFLDLGEFAMFKLPNWELEDSKQVERVKMKWERRRKIKQKKMWKGGFQKEILNVE